MHGCATNTGKEKILNAMAAMMMASDGPIVPLTPLTGQPRKRRTRKGGGGDAVKQASALKTYADGLCGTLTDKKVGSQNPGKHLQEKG